MEWVQHEQRPWVGMGHVQQKAGGEAGTTSCSTLSSRHLGLYPEGSGGSGRYDAVERHNQIWVLKSCLSGAVRVELGARWPGGQCGGQANAGVMRAGSEWAKVQRKPRLPEGRDWRVWKSMGKGA